MMNFVRVIEIALFVMALMFVLTQIVIPAFRGTLLFPWFRREGALQADLARAKQQKRERELECDVQHEGKTVVCDEPQQKDKTNGT